MYHDPHRQPPLLLPSGDDGEPDVVHIGHRLAWGGDALFGLGADDRRRHVFVVGQTGTGKTTLLRNVLVQLIHTGHGVGLIDPHGDVAAELLDLIPPNRTDDVVYFNPSDLEHPVAWNLLANVAPDDRHRVASGIVGALKSVWRESWGPRMEYILGAAVMALLECRNASLLGLPRMLVDDGYRDWVLRQVTDPAVRSFWLREFASYDLRFRREAVAPIQNKVGQLLMAAPLRNVLGQVRNRLDVRYLIDHRRVFVANLAKGRLGEDKANLLGAMLVTQFQQAAMSRADVPERERVDFTLVVDEFANFTTDAFASLLSEARKYRLGLVLAGQYLDQAKAGVMDAVFGNAGTMIAFRVGERDGAVLSRQFGGHYDAALYSSLDNHCVVAKVLSNGRYGDPFLGTTLPPLDTAYGRGENLIRRSRERYATPRRRVEERIRRWMNGPGAP